MLLHREFQSRSIFVALKELKKNNMQPLTSGLDCGLVKKSISCFLPDEVLGYPNKGMVRQQLACGG
jgi:hypothetical protein